MQLQLNSRAEDRHMGSKFMTCHAVGGHTSLLFGFRLPPHCLFFSPFPFRPKRVGTEVEKSKLNERREMDLWSWRYLPENDFITSMTENKFDSANPHWLHGGDLVWIELISYFNSQIHPSNIPFGQHKRTKQDDLRCNHAIFRVLVGRCAVALGRCH